MRRRTRRLVAAAVAFLVVASLAFAGIALSTERAEPAPPRPAIEALTPTVPGRYDPVPAGPPATDPGGQWTAETVGGR